MRRRWRFALGVTALAALGAVVCSMHAMGAARAQAGKRGVVAALGARMPTSDLALSGGARWLRAPGLEDPYAAFADGPAAHDPDPAGAAIPPPREVYFPESTQPAVKK